MYREAVKEKGMNEIRVSIRELKNKLCVYLRWVKAGQIIPAKTTIEERMQGMIASGSAAWNGEKLTPYRTKIINRGAGSLSDLIVEDRE
jgi:hypothetical protein